MKIENEYKAICDIVNHKQKNIETNWYLVSGAPSSGKTTSLNILKNIGYKVNPDISRKYIEDQVKLGCQAKDIRSNEVKLQKIIFCLMVRNLLSLNVNDLILHDYSLIDNIPFVELAGLKIDNIMWKSTELFRFKKVFLFEPISLQKDGIRTETEEDQKYLFELFMKTYTHIGYNPIIVHKGTIDQRHQFILSHLPNNQNK